MNQPPDVSYLESLPLELLYPILLGLKFTDVLQLCQVSSKLTWICRDWVFWTDKAWHDYKFPRDRFDKTQLTDPRERYYQIRRYYPYPDRYRYLIRAAELGDLGFVQDLINTGVITKRSDLDWPLSGAARTGHLDIVQYLVGLGVPDVNWALSNAAQQDHLDIVRYLVENGATGLNPALEQAAGQGHVDIIAYLIDAGATSLNSALRAAAWTCHLEAVKYLIQRGANEIGLVLNAARANLYPRAIKPQDINECHAIIRYLESLIHAEP
jgi:ankyrin repeat protein